MLSGAVVSVGTNANIDNIASGIIVGGIGGIGVDKVVNVLLGGTPKKVAPNTPIKFKVVTAALGVSLVFEARCALIGYYL